MSIKIPTDSEIEAMWLGVEPNDCPDCAVFDRPCEDHADQEQEDL
jgi:hypothetical protein